MKELTYVVKDKLGVHARPAGTLVKEAMKFQSEIIIECNEKKADAKRIFSVMGIGAKCGDTLIFKISGTDEDSALKYLKEFLEKNL